MQLHDRHLHGHLQDGVCGDGARVTRMHAMRHGHVLCGHQHALPVVCRGQISRHCCPDDVQGLPQRLVGVGGRPICVLPLRCGQVQRAARPDQLYVLPQLRGRNVWNWDRAVRLHLMRSGQIPFGRWRECLQHMQRGDVLHRHRECLRQLPAWIHPDGYGEQHVCGLRRRPIPKHVHGVDLHHLRGGHVCRGDGFVRVCRMQRWQISEFGRSRAMHQLRNWEVSDGSGDERVRRLCCGRVCQRYRHLRVRSLRSRDLFEHNGCESMSTVRGRVWRWQPGRVSL